MNDTLALTETAEYPTLMHTHAHTHKARLIDGLQICCAKLQIFIIHSCGLSSVATCSSTQCPCCHLCACVCLCISTFIIVRLWILKWSLLLCCRCDYVQIYFKVILLHLYFTIRKLLILWHNINKWAHQQERWKPHCAPQDWILRETDVTVTWYVVD